MACQRRVVPRVALRHARIARAHHHAPSLCRATQHAQQQYTNFLDTLKLVDDGGMRIYDKDDKLAWYASDKPCHM